MDDASALARPRSKAPRRYAMLERWQPLPLVLYFTAIILGACFAPSLPLGLAAIVAGSCLLVQVGGVGEARYIGSALLLGLLVVLLAPLFDVTGETVLFSPFGRPYTAEALLRGALTGALVAAMIVWFAAFDRVCGSDGVLRACGKVAPRIGMVTSLVIQMVPRLGRRAAQVRSARIGANLAAAQAPLPVRAKDAAAVFFTVAASSLESSIVCADAMESRGYGTGPRTDSLREPYGWDERLFCLAAAFFFALFIALSVLRAAGIVAEPWGELAAAAVFAHLAFIPFVLNLLEDIRWLF